GSRGGRWWASSDEAATLALPYAQRALELEPDLVDAHYVMAMVYRLKGQPVETLEAIERILKLDPDHPQALTWAAWSLMSMGKPERAVGLLERCVKVHGAAQSYLAASWIGNCYEMLGRNADAQKAMRQLVDVTLDLVRRPPGAESAHARTLLGIALVQIGQAEPGFAQIERALELAPDDGRIHYNAACAFARTGQTERALHELEEGTKHISSYIGDWPLHDPDMKNLWDHPEFIRMFGKAGKSSGFRSPTG